MYSTKVTLVKPQLHSSESGSVRAYWNHWIGQQAREEIAEAVDYYHENQKCYLSAFAGMVLGGLSGSVLGAAAATYAGMVAGDCPWV